jgi:hypothetical protein
MNLKLIFGILLKIFRKIYLIIDPTSNAFGRNLKMFPMKDYSNELIYENLLSDKPVMIARFGSNEIACMINYLGVSNPESFKSISGFIKGKTPLWWWNKSTINQMGIGAGFFPTEIDPIEKFCKLMIEDITYVDILGSYLKEEQFFNDELKNANRVVLEDLEPMFARRPWTWALEGKNILVIHPFTETIEEQYKKRELLFENNLLPEFNLITLKAVQSVAGSKTEYKDWFKALDSMKAQIDEIDFDICIIGCGAYGLPLAAHVKRLGKKAIHLGGATQLLFGIKGRRWVDNPVLFYPYINLFNEHWVYPLEINRPKDASKVEDACYW